MTKQVLDTMVEKMNKSVAVYRKELASMRAGRANPQLLDRILVDYYGSPTPINQVANISIPEPRIIQIAPWEQSMLKVIEKAIQKSDKPVEPIAFQEKKFFLPLERIDPVKIGLL